MKLQLTLIGGSRRVFMVSHQMPTWKAFGGGGSWGQESVLIPLFYLESIALSQFVVIYSPSLVMFWLLFFPVWREQSTFHMRLSHWQPRSPGEHRGYPDSGGYRGKSCPSQRWERHSILFFSGIFFFFFFLFWAETYHILRGRWRDTDEKPEWEMAFLSLRGVTYAGRCCKP